MLKYASNSFHALKVVFANEIAAIAGALGIEGQQVMKEFVLDTKLNVSPAYLRPGFSFGGSCLPKDTQALINTAERLGVAVPALSSILPSNNRRIVTVLEEIERLEARRIGFWGVAFKPGTDDTRESPILKIVDELLLRRTQYQLPIDLVIADEATVLNTIKNRLSGQSRLTTSAQDFCHELDLIVLGTRDIDPDLRKLISNSSIRVIDLAYFDADPAIAKEPNYRLLSKKRRSNHCTSHTRYPEKLGKHSFRSPKHRGCQRLGGSNIRYSGKRRRHRYRRRPCRTWPCNVPL